MVDTYLTEIYDKDFHNGYDFVYSINLHPKNDLEFRLHSHRDFYEIVLFLAGDAQFHIEGNIYHSHPHDIFIARPGEMHHNVFLSETRYERIVLFVRKSYFKLNHCEELENFFLTRALGFDCQIPAAIANQLLCTLLLKMNTYLQQSAITVANGVLLEFLYLLNHIEQPLSSPVIEDSRIQKIIAFINAHLDSSLTLDLLADTFYMNKFHLCRVFHRITGYTINQYINQKRLLLALSLYDQGQTLLEASSNSGFNSYSSFYKLYKKQFGTSPKQYHRHLFPEEL